MVKIVVPYFVLNEKLATGSHSEGKYICNGTRILCIKIVSGC